jgi:hypothetical protein
MKYDRLIFALMVIVAAASFSVGARVHADPEPALDRQIVERMTRALEAQAHATEALVRATERCKK